MPRPASPHIAPIGLTPLAKLAGLGPKNAEKFAVKGLLTLQDLWLHLPLRFEDRTRLTRIADLRIGEPAQIEGRVDAVERGFRWRPMLRVAVDDDSHATLTLRFFHFSGAQAAQFLPGRRIRCYGEARPGQYGLEMVHPSYRFLAANEEMALTDRLDPVYPPIDGIGPQTLRKLIVQALDKLPSDEEMELLPASSRARFSLPSFREALRFAHQPPVGTDASALRDGRHPAIQRLALEELLAQQLSLRRQRIAIRAEHAPPLRGTQALTSKFIAALPYELTHAQQRVANEIGRDLVEPHPMLRLVQGDVGSGKTVVAALAALRAVEEGKQAAVMAPTELLAEQHLKNFRAWLEPLGVRVAWLAGKVAGKARAAVLADIASGAAPVVIGTHALMQEGVSFHQLALAIVDEQHRFGVHQRLALKEKGMAGEVIPHQLVLTATPIPRTLAMSAYADLDVSVIDEMPPGRTPVQTVVIHSERRGEVIERIHLAIAEGRQAYWVCPLIEDSEEVEAQSAQSTFEALQAALPKLRIGLLHGRMKPVDKQAAMAKFKEGETQLLVATTVIEVGVDVPNASLMVIENAERLGLAQLHQLRGRVGRGAAASSCVLMFKPPLSAMARERLDVMRRTTDGFVIAEKDLELRGPGELLGTKQTGEAGLRIADVMRDAAMLPMVQELAETLMSTHPELADAVVERWVGSARRFAGA